MRRQTIMALRGAVMLLMLSVAAASLAACGGAAPTAVEPASGPEPTLFAPVTEEALPEDPSEIRVEILAPTPAAVRVSAVAPPVTEGRSERTLNHAEPLDTAEADDAPTDDVPSGDAPALDSAQVVAAFEDVLHGIYEKNLPSVVYLRVPSPANSALRGVPGVPDDLLWGSGSGFVWDDEGHIVTNYHVVDSVIGESGEVIVIFADSTQATGTVVGGDPHSDLAVVKLEEGDWDLQPATLGDSSEVRVGQLSVAIGAPFGQQFTMTSGIVSAVGRNIQGEGRFSIPEVIQTDSAINPGNSGGPLLDRLGRVIGINTQIISQTGNYSGVGLAVPINIARRVVPPLIADGEFTYPWLGVNIAPVDAAYAESLELPEGVSGALVLDVVEDSPADKAGLRGSDSTVSIYGVDYPSGGDIITAIGSHEVISPSELIAHLTYSARPGDTVTFQVFRDGKYEEIEVTLGQRPDSIE